VTRRGRWILTCGATVAVLAAAVVAVGAGDRAQEPTVVVRSMPPPAGVVVQGLPNEGIAVEDGDAVVFLTVHGEVVQRLEGLGLGPAPALGGDILLQRRDGRYAVDRHTGALRRLSHENDVPLAPGARLVLDDASNRFDFEVSDDRDIVTHTSGSNDDNAVAYDVRTGNVRLLPVGCRVADRHDAAWFLVCENRETWMSSIVRLDADDTTTVLAESRDWWEAVMVSPDGRRFLTTVTYDCAPPKVFVGSTTTPNAVKGLGAAMGADEEPDAIALGWTADGAPVFTAAGSCGPPLLAPGVYAFDGKTVRTIYATSVDEDWTAAAMWTRPPRPQPASISSRRS